MVHLLGVVKKSWRSYTHLEIQSVDDVICERKSFGEGSRYLSDLYISDTDDLSDCRLGLSATSSGTVC